MVARFFTTLLIFQLLLVPPCANSAPLEELQNSSEYKGTVRGVKRLKLPAWADPDSNYVSLFEGSNTKARIFKLLGDDHEGFTVQSSRLNKKDEFISATRVYGFYQSKKGILVSLVIPHPAYLHLVQERLVMELEALWPNPATVLSRDEVKIGDDPAELLVCRDGTTVIVIPLPMEAMIIGKASNAKEAKEMNKLLESINTGEIKRQLTS